MLGNWSDKMTQKNQQRARHITQCNWQFVSDIGGILYFSRPFALSMQMCCNDKQKNYHNYNYQKIKYVRKFQQESG